MKHRTLSRLVVLVLPLLLIARAMATPAFVEHFATNGVFGESGSTTMRNPAVPREDEAVAIWIKIGYSFYYDNVAIYYTTDGANPSGTKGNAGNASTTVLRSSTGGVSFVRNEPASPANIDWWKATLPVSTRTYNSTIKYVISAWNSGGGIEVWANNYGCDDNVCNDVGNAPTYFSFTNRLAWPGAGAGAANPSAGYPDVHFWKEEAVTGNKFINVMLDQNGSLYDVYYPSVGGLQGMGTKNEGYVDGLDTFPPGLPSGSRGQMNLNQATAGIRVDGVTHWLSNLSGTSYTGVAQSYVDGSNTVKTSQTLTAGGNSIKVEQFDFSPYGVTFPNDIGGNPNRGLFVKRMILTNQSASTKTVNVYFYGDFALNGGDGYDGMYKDTVRGAMVAYDNTTRDAAGVGEYNPTTFGSYTKAVSVFLAAAMKSTSAVGGASGTASNDAWSDTSSDQGQGWIGMKITLPPNTPKEVNILVAGGFDNFANATATYQWQTAPAIDWFMNNSMAAAMTTTDTTWSNWVNSGTTIDFPDDRYDKLFNRSKLASILHLDGKSGGIIAGMHNGAYPYVWPRDAVYAAVSFARTGHVAEANEIYRFLKDVAYRGNESWGKGFWYQKYTTDGYIVWGAPQVDESAVLPWGVRFQYDVTGNSTWLNSMWPSVRDAGFASSSDSSLDSRMYFDESVNLMYSMSVWEDSFAHFIYSNANCVRGLRDAAWIATTVGQAGDAGTFTSRANTIKSGLDARLDWNGENTDISHLGVAYPFEVYEPTDNRVKLVVDRMNGVANDRFGNNHPIVNFSGEFSGLINRYWGDNYWNGGPWFLSTLWYGCYYAQRANQTPGLADINTHKTKVDLALNFLGPIGFGAEQISPSNSLLYPGQSDFRLQAAWPNVWESMSTFMDSMMLFLDFRPNAAGNTFVIRPKLPSTWSTMSFNNVSMGSHRLNIKVTSLKNTMQHLITNLTGLATTLDTTVKLPLASRPARVVVNGVRVNYTWDASSTSIRVSTPLQIGANAQTLVEVGYTRDSKTRTVVAD